MLGSLAKNPDGQSPQLTAVNVEKLRNKEQNLSEELNLDSSLNLTPYRLSNLTSESSNRADVSDVSFDSIRKNHYFL